MVKRDRIEPFRYPREVEPIDFRKIGRAMMDVALHPFQATSRAIGNLSLGFGNETISANIHQQTEEYNLTN